MAKIVFFYMAGQPAHLVSVTINGDSLNGVKIILPRKAGPLYRSVQEALKAAGLKQRSDARCRLNRGFQRAALLANALEKELGRIAILLVPIEGNPSLGKLAQGEADASPTLHWVRHAVP